LKNILLATALLTAAAPAQAREWVFDVLLDRKPIGQHRFVLDQADAQSARLTSSADFKVTFLLVSVYEYRHLAREAWQDGCLARLDSETQENREHTKVQGRRNGSHFHISGPQGSQLLPPCVMTFAYWNPAILQQDKLLNPQTGEWLDITVHKLGMEQLQLRDRSVQAERYRLQAPKVNLDLWYTPDRQWVALRSTTPEGRVINYQLR